MMHQIQKIMAPRNSSNPDTGNGKIGTTITYQEISQRMPFDAPEQLQVLKKTPGTGQSNRNMQQ